MIYLIVIIFFMSFFGVSKTVNMIGMLIVTYFFIKLIGFIFPILIIPILIFLLYSYKNLKKYDNFFGWEFHDDFNENQERNDYYRKQNYYRTNNGFSANKNEYYSILGAEESDSLEEIKKKYKNLAKKYHPDLHTSKSEQEQKENEMKFKKINDAYSYIKKIKK